MYFLCKYKVILIFNFYLYLLMCKVFLFAFSTKKLKKFVYSSIDFFINNNAGNVFVIKNIKAG